MGVGGCPCAHVGVRGKLVGALLSLLYGFWGSDSGLARLQAFSPPKHLSSPVITLVLYLIYLFRVVYGFIFAII